MSSPNPAIEEYGWHAVPISPQTLLAQSATADKPAAPLAITDTPLPSSPLADAVLKYAREELGVETFKHSMRVFYYGT